jgi:betaine-aldehyde dehydrogenase
MNTAVAAHSLTSIKLNLPAGRRAYYGGKWHEPKRNVDEINAGTGESLGPVAPDSGR